MNPGAHEARARALAIASLHPPSLPAEICRFAGWTKADSETLFEAFTCEIK